MMNKVSIETCRCCEGTEILTPKSRKNRPGLSELRYRTGTHSSFLETMMARLSNHRFPELKGLSTRDRSDPSIAMLDAWATVADVLTFYQERIANEGYLPTATERRSILELAKLVGYKLRPGVASSVYVGYTIDENIKEEVIIPAGSQVKSLPGPDEVPQTFETSDELMARAEWNVLKPRMSRPKKIFLSNVEKIYIKGISNNLNANDPVLLISNNNGEELREVVKTIESIDVDSALERTEICFIKKSIKETKAVQSKGNGFNKSAIASTKIRGINDRNELLSSLLLDPSVQERNTHHLSRDSTVVFKPGADYIPQLLTTFNSELKDTYYSAIASIRLADLHQLPEISTFRAKAAPFGHNAPLKPVRNEDGIVIDSEEWCIFRSTLGIKLSGVVSPVIGGGLEAPLEDLSKILSENLSKSLLAGNFELELNLSVGDKQYIEENVSIEIPNSSENEITKIITLNGTKLDIKLTVFPKTATSGVAGNIFSINFCNERYIFSHFPNTASQPQIGVSFDSNFIPFNPDGITNSHIFDDKKYRSFYAEDGTNLDFTIVGDDVDEPDYRKKIWLDAEYDQVLPGSHISITRTSWDEPRIFTVTGVQNTSLALYGITGKSTVLVLDKVWLDDCDILLSSFRETTVFLQEDELQLADYSITESIVVDDNNKDIVLDGLHKELETGRWVIISGERTDIPNTNGVLASELAMIASINEVLPEIEGDTIHSSLTLVTKLAYQYKRDTVKIYANVVKATHGETRHEILGSGDGSQTLQSFELKQFPLTYTAASNPTGVDNTLSLYVNDIKWHEADTLAGLQALDRKFITKTNDVDKTALIFGNGEKGSRLPTGTENVRAEYRNGIGQAGNVKAGQISLLGSKPLGVKEVINPLRASGGADRENRNQARRHAPLAVKALDRLVSVQDYEDFAKVFAGIGKARAIELSDGRRTIVHVTIAGADDIPIDNTSDLYRNLKQALLDLGDPLQPVILAVRELMFVIISTNIKILPDYLWEPVEIKIRERLLDVFSFENRELGQDVLLSDVVSVIQSVKGVAYVDVDVFSSVPEKNLLKTYDETLEGYINQWRLMTPDEIAIYISRQLVVNDEPAKNDKQDKQQRLPRSRIPVNMADYIESNVGQKIRPAQLAFLTPDVPETLILNQIKEVAHA